MRRLLAALLLAFLASSMLAVQGAPAWLQIEGDRWAFGVFTIDNDGKQTDPINVIFRGAGRTVDPQTMLEEWEDADDVRDRGDMRTRPCNRGSQDLKFRHLDLRSPRYLLDDVDFHRSTSATCGDQYHARVWDSVEHDQNTSAHAGGVEFDRWAVAAVHHEERVFDCRALLVPTDCIHHEIDKPWEKVEKITLFQLEEYCSWRNWRRLPGSPPDRYRGWNTNGKMSRISPERVEKPGPCD